MQYNYEKHAKALEYDKIKQMLAACAGCEGSKALALALTPATGYEDAVRMLQHTDDAFVLNTRFSLPEIYDLKDCRPALGRARIGGRISPGELLEIAKVLRAGRICIDFRSRCEQKTSLDYNFDRLFRDKSLEEKITSAIISPEEISDHASATLAEIRRKIRALEQKARDVLDKMIRSSSYAKFLQDNIVTQRDSRYVVPVKAEYRNEIRGLVHDTSSSGATLFIEPMAVVEANNEIRVMRAKEEQEIDRILYELSGMVGDLLEPIRDSYEALMWLDLQFAKARLGDKMNAVVPKLNRDGRTILHKARHPLISKDKVVPIDISIGNTFDTLVITGPNTGGKTVALKTVGLLSLMAMSGMMVPAAHNSEVGFYRYILADIGDEQSIEQSLSTFSAHMTNIVSILQVANHESLVLLDELGAGTDPVEGAALATAIIEKLRTFGAKTVATTHYAELKMYALKTEGVENAGCEFDVATLSPTYKLIIGIPGRSNAFAISERLGIQEDIIEAAKEHVSSDNARFEEVVQQLEETRSNLEKEKEQAYQDRIEAQRLKTVIQEQEKKMQLQQERITEQARAQAARMVESVKTQGDRLLEELDKLLKQKENENFLEMASQIKSKYKANLNRLRDMANPVEKRTNADYKLPRKIKAGDRVLIVDINAEGTALTDQANGETISVQTGIFKTKVKINNLRLLEKKSDRVTINNKARITTNATKANRDVKNELDVRGMTVDEAILEIDKFIDNSVLLGLNTVTIIHGKGTGALRKGVQDHLRRHRSVRTFRLGVYGEGEAGVTVVELK